MNEVCRAPEVLAAISPHHAVKFFLANGWRGFHVLGSVFLVLTGAEALYADMGHFGRKPIRLAWFGLVLPALFLNYLGQGALVLHHPDAAANPFYRLAPSWALYPLVGLATGAAVIASQALISGSFSLTMQAVQLGYAPRVAIAHTSSAERGQIYIPVGQLGVDGGLHRAGGWLPIVRQPGRRLRHRRGADDADHHVSVLLRRAAVVGLESARERACSARSFSPRSWASSART